jgi:ATP-binding cassette subfamily B protein
MRARKFPLIEQLDGFDCGPACLSMIAQHYGRYFTLDQLKSIGSFQRAGISLAGLSSLAEAIGFRTLLVKVTYQKLVSKVAVPFIAHWNQNHYVVVYKVTPTKVFVADPAIGRLTYTVEEFMQGWAQDVRAGEKQGVLMVLEPTPLLAAQGQAQKTVNKASIKFILKYVFLYKKYIFQIALGLLLGSVLQLVFPFITQIIVDQGISNNNVNFITIALLTQLVLYASSTVIEFMRSWLLMHVSSRISLFIISDFLSKLMQLPIKYFDSKVVGDLVQRIQDNKRIEEFITSTLLKSIFSIFSIAILSTVLAIFNLKVFTIFFIGTSLELIWIFVFLNKIKLLDKKNFSLLGEDQSKIFELITGMQEIKFNNVEHQKRWEWESIQASIFENNLQKLRLNQYQEAYRFFSYLQIVLIVYVSAISVINHQMTLGAMMSIIFIIGQLNVPVSQLINFVLAAQLVKISLERLGEIHGKEDEQLHGVMLETSLTESRDIQLNNISFNYPGMRSYALKNIDLLILGGKVTAIVGSSGSGKTTLLKILMKFYDVNEGVITVGDVNINKFQQHFWRSKCGAVMQDSFIFSDTIYKNIAFEEQVDEVKLLNACRSANILEFIQSLPTGFNTKIGASGSGLSQGQKQRLLIARAVYKNPEFLFFDEATNALDANNETIIMQNLTRFFHNRTVIVAAHRLSTVKDADQIIVLDKGQVVEIGTHQALMSNRRQYYNLVHNQLDMNLLVA